MENGVLELDVAATEATNFLGVVFRAASPRLSNEPLDQPADGNALVCCSQPVGHVLIDL